MKSRNNINFNDLNAEEQIDFIEKKLKLKKGTTMGTKTLTKEQLLENRVKKAIQEKFLGGPGFGDNRHIINGMQNRMRKEASIDVPEAPIKSKGKSMEAPVQDQGGMDMPEMPKMEKPKAPEKPKPKAKDWNELVDEVVLYIKFASDIVGDMDGVNASKILDKLYDSVGSKLATPEESVAEINEKKKLKGKK